MEQFTLVPAPSDEGKFVILAKLPIELMEKLEMCAREMNNNIAISFDKDKGLMIDGKLTKFRFEKEGLEHHDCYSEEGDYWTKVGPIQRKLFFEHNLSSNDHARIANSAKQAEINRKGRKSQFIEDVPNKKKSTSKSFKNTLML